jgi:hypothetical protein
MKEYFTLITNIEKEIDNKHKSTLDRYKSQGQLDGKMNSPEASFDGLSPAEQAIKAIYEGFLATFKAQTNQIIGEQKANYEHIGSDVNELYNNPQIVEGNIQSLKSNAENQLNLEKQLHQTNVNQIYQNPTYLNAKNNSEKVQREYKEESERLGRAIPITPKYWYIPVMIIIGISEFYLNYSAFTSFKGSVLETSIMALSAGLVFPFLAHYLGVILRRKQNYTKETIFTIILLSGIAIGLDLFIAKQVVELGRKGLYIKNATQANTIFWFRFTIVIAIFVVGCLISYFIHEPSKNFLDLFRLKNKAQNDFEKIEKETSNSFNSEQKRFQEKVNQINQKLQQDINFEKNRLSILNQEFKEAEKNLKKSIEYVSNTLKSINAWYKVTIFEYRQQNLQNRVDRKFPQSWGKEPQDLTL